MSRRPTAKIANSSFFFNIHIYQMFQYKRSIICHVEKMLFDKRKNSIIRTGIMTGSDNRDSTTLRNFKY